MSVTFETNEECKFDCEVDLILTRLGDPPICGLIRYFFISKYTFLTIDLYISVLSLAHSILFEKTLQV